MAAENEEMRMKKVIKKMNNLFLLEKQK
jgi:hypothetical protein